MGARHAADWKPEVQVLCSTLARLRVPRNREARTRVKRRHVLAARRCHQRLVEEPPAVSVSARAGPRGRRSSAVLTSRTDRWARRAAGGANPFDAALAKAGAWSKMLHNPRVSVAARRDVLAELIETVEPRRVSLGKYEARATHSTSTPQNARRCSRRRVAT